MEEDYLKETICMAKALFVIERWIEENSELTETLARIIELKEQGKIHQVMHIIARSSAIFCLGVALRALFNAEQNESYGAIMGLSASSSFSLICGFLNSKVKQESACLFEELKEDLVLLMHGKYNIGIETLTEEAQERFLNVFISEILKDKHIVKKIKQLSKQGCSNCNNNTEL